ncbi:hypothetical protein [Rhodopila globiformis]|nr:hypothetical protein [Rhodopila globiformis]
MPADRDRPTRIAGLAIAVHRILAAGLPGCVHAAYLKDGLRRFVV